MSNKKYSPVEVAIAVLKKTEQLYKASTLAKSDIAAPATPSPAPTAPAPTAPPVKGHIKLAKFMGRMEAKREKPVSKAETAKDSPKEKPQEIKKTSKIKRP